MPLTDITNQEHEAVLKFRDRLTPKALIPANKLENDYFLVRYLRATSLNMEKAEKMVEYYANYCKEKNTESLIVEKFPSDFSQSFFSYLGGRDHDNRPLVVITHGGLWNVKKVIEAGREDMFIRYVLHIAVKFEAEVLKRSVDYGYFVADVSNIAYGNFIHKRTLEVVLSLVNTLEKLSPYVIRKVYFINAPRIWVAFFNTIRALVTVSADIYAYDAEKKWKAALREIFPEEGLCPELGGTDTTYELV